MATHPEAPAILREATEETRVLLVHAPYPGRLKFDGQPTSLLCAAGPLVRGLASESRLEEVGYLDPLAATTAFYGRLAEIGAAGNLRVACISTSTAAIEEAARVASVLRESDPDVLILAGGPHEDDCEEPMALRLPAVDISIGGDGEDLLCRLVRDFLDTAVTRVSFLGSLPSLLSSAAIRGSARVAARELGTMRVQGASPPAADDLLIRPWTDRPVRFDVFGGRETLPLMVSRGCSYGRCTFCAEAGDGRQRIAADFSALQQILGSRPGAALYFQDSIFPASRHVREVLLPMLRDARRPWGCQVYLPALSQEFVRLLGENGCAYAYTGIESGAEEIRASVGKPALRDSLLYTKLALLADARIALGISLMFGSLDRDGELVETEHTVERTEALAERLIADGMGVAGFYPNVLTVLPGTALARGLSSTGVRLDFYSMPRVPEFAHLEDGGIGYNFASLPGRGRRNSRLAAVIASASRRLTAPPERTTGRLPSHRSIR